MARKKPVSLSLGRISDAIASLEADIRAASDLPRLQRKRLLGLLSGIDGVLHAFCMKDGGESDFIVGPPAK